MLSYMRNFKYIFIVWHNFRHAHLQEVGLTQIPLDQVSSTTLRCESKDPTNNYMVTARGSCVK